MSDQTLPASPPLKELGGADLPAAAETAQLRLDPTLIVLICLLLIAVLTIAYVAAEVILPLVLAFVLKLLLQPCMRLLERLRLPRSLSALLLIFAVFGVIVAGGAAVSGPATNWAQKLPEGLPRLEERLKFLSRPIQTLQTFLNQVDGGKQTGVAGITDALFSGTQHFASGFFETILFLFFLLAGGDTFLRRFVELLPRFSDKRQVVALSQEIEEHISAYLITITLMNGAVGLATGLIMWICGVGDPVLWGSLAFLLNFVPIMGPFTGIALFVFVGLLTMDGLGAALLPAGLYLIVHLLEGEMITPMLLARRFTLNPVLVILSLIFWFWMWGAVGAILAVPMLAITKIICDGVGPLNAIGHFLGAGQPSGQAETPAREGTGQ
jgi:predicted PurR-regulated permease PerM